MEHNATLNAVYRAHRAATAPSIGTGIFVRNEAVSPRDAAAGFDLASAEALVAAGGITKRFDSNGFWYEF